MERLSFNPCRLPSPHLRLFDANSIDDFNSLNALRTRAYQSSMKNRYNALKMGNNHPKLKKHNNNTNNNNANNNATDLQTNWVKYSITVRTHQALGSGTDANVYCSLFGTNGRSPALLLDSSSSAKPQQTAFPPPINLFEMGQTNRFELQGYTEDVGEVLLVYLELESKVNSLFDDWLVAEVSVTKTKKMESSNDIVITPSDSNGNEGETWYFPAHQWIKAGEGLTLPRGTGILHLNLNQPQEGYIYL